jgi:hypothetical protein
MITNYPPIVDAALYIARMYSLSNDEHTYEDCSRIQLTSFYTWAFRRLPSLRKAVAISARKELLGCA